MSPTSTVPTAFLRPQAQPPTQAVAPLALPAKAVSVVPAAVVVVAVVVPAPVVAPTAPPRLAAATANSHHLFVPQQTKGSRSARPFCFF